jgi:molybdate transport system substrate-binding protein
MRVQAVCLACAASVFFSSLVCCSSAEPENELVVSAAMSLKKPMEDISALYHARHDARVHLNFGSSGLLSSQVMQGAPVDVYASASVRFLDELEEGGFLLDGTRLPLARNRLVLITPASSTLTLDDWSELTSVENLALGNPKTVPAGAYAQECLENLNLWESLRPRMVFAEHVRQVLDYAAQSEVEAALVYATDAKILPEAVRVVAMAPENTHSPIRYGIAVVASTRAPDAARRFVDLATSPAGMEVLESYGFIRPVD